MKAEFINRDCCSIHGFPCYVCAIKYNGVYGPGYYNGKIILSIDREEKCMSEYEKNSIKWLNDNGETPMIRIIGCKNRENKDKDKLYLENGDIEYAFIHYMYNVLYGKN